MSAARLPATAVRDVKVPANLGLASFAAFPSAAFPSAAFPSATYPSAGLAASASAVLAFDVLACALAASAASGTDAPSAAAAAPAEDEMALAAGRVQASAREEAWRQGTLQAA